EDGRVIKIQKGESDKQTRRELELYENLSRRKMSNFEHIPRYYGMVQTNLGEGFVVDLISDFDGSVSKSLWWHFEQGYPVAEFVPYLDELRQYLLDNLIVFSVDMGRYNILFQKTSPHQARLVVIDGLGNHTAINWLDNIAYFARRKIDRRWRRFIGRLNNYSAEIMRTNDLAPRTLDAAYKRAG
ncbi:MAG: YrbL family protein, partial [Gammaproteobacteria bacterium]|nr:YrbL family protein [Gammaproteobacteria bacterium]